MDSLTISSTAFEGAGGALTQASGFLRDAKQVRAGDAGDQRLIAKSEEAAEAWKLAIDPLTEAVAADGKQSIAAGQEFARVDSALVGALTGGTP